MEACVTLSEYLNKYNDNCSSDINEFCSKGVNREWAYSYFLSNTYVDDRLLSGTVELKKPTSRNNDSAYVEFIDDVIRHLVSQGSQNVLVNGYLDPAENAAWSSNIYNPFVSFNANHLKSKFWKRFCYEIGRENFLGLVLNSKGYIQLESSTHFQIFGEPPNAPRTKKRVLSKKLSSFSHKDVIKNSLHLFPNEPSSLIAAIYGQEGSSRFKRKLYDFQSLLNGIIKNDSRCNYRSIFYNVISVPTSPNKSNYSNSTPFNLVLKFVFIIVGKLFPLQIWGTMRNKNIIFNGILNFLKTGSGCRPKVENLIGGVKINQVAWLFKKGKATSKQDHLLKSSIYSQFISWFFEKFICRLVSLFWYVVEIPNLTCDITIKGDLLFFTQEIWYKMSKDWLANYVNEYLIPSRPPQGNIITLATKQNHTFGRFRLIPKPVGFRMLCIPYKTSIGLVTLSNKQYKEEKFQYLNYLNKVVRPLREVLTYKVKNNRTVKRKSNLSCMSIHEVCSYIQNYKSRISSVDGGLSGLQVMKFDMESCYDKLNQSKIIECIESLFEEDSEDDRYFVRSYQEYDKVKFNNKRQKLSIWCSNSIGVTHPMVLPRSSKETNVLIDKTNTTKFSREEILDSCKSQIFNSYINLQQKDWKWYKRKIGIFQGHPLSATFCEVVYDRIVDKLFDFLDDKSLLLRLADDFLFISTEYSTCKRVFDIVNGPLFKDYGAFINMDKTVWVNHNEHTDVEIINFVGVQLNTHTLDISRPDDINLSSASISECLSFEKLYLSLRRFYLTKLEDDYLDLTFSPIENVLANIDTILKVIYTTISKNYALISKWNPTFSEDKLKLFILTFLNSIIEKFQRVNQTSTNTDTIIVHFTLCTKEYLNHNSKFEGVLGWLDAIQ